MTTTTQTRRSVNMNTIGRLLCGKLEGESPVDVLFVQGANIVTMNPE